MAGHRIVIGEQSNDWRALFVGDGDLSVSGATPLKAVGEPDPEPESNPGEAVRDEVVKPQVMPKARRRSFGSETFASTSVIAPEINSRCTSTNPHFLRCANAVPCARETPVMDSLGFVATITQGKVEDRFEAAI